MDIPNRLSVALVSGRTSRVSAPEVLPNENEPPSEDATVGVTRLSHVTEDALSGGPLTVTSQFSGVEDQ